MGRDRRAIDPDSIYHAITRGNNRQPIVWNDGDRHLFVRELDKLRGGSSGTFTPGA